MRQPKILVFSGSSRSGSYNSKLAALVGKHLALADAEVTHISLADYPLPLYDGDLEAGRGIPAHAQTLKTLFQKQDGVFIACPEYNAGVTPVLKNMIDWISRPTDPGEGEPTAFRNRVFALGAASTGGYGGIRGLMGMRTILEVGLGAAVLPQMVTVARAAAGFTAKGDLVDDKASGQLETLVQTLNQQTRLLLGP
jgi:chromate reductase, NAD(P)H dehydrogenase (quinone)